MVQEFNLVRTRKQNNETNLAAKVNRTRISRSRQNSYLKKLKLTLQHSIKFVLFFPGFIVRSLNWRYCDQIMMAREPPRSRDPLVPSDYFRHVPVHALLCLPLTWVLLPVSAFAPNYLLAPYIWEPVMRFILYLQVINYQNRSHFFIYCSRN